MYNVLIKNVRCFSDEQIIPIKPITILVGENSSGKSTFLAMTRIAWDLLQGKQSLDFNEDPFILGTFDQIATYREGRAGRAKEFVIGIQVNTQKRKNDENETTVIIKGRFISEGGKPKLSEWLFDARKYQAKVTFKQDSKQDILITTPSGKFEIGSGERSFPFSMMSTPEFFSFLRFLLINDKDADKYIKGKKPKEQELSYLSSLGFQVSRALGPRPYAIAPIRTRPLITYDPLKDIPSPEGAHIPTLMAKLSATDKTAWNNLRESLDSFGRASGLFDDVEVRKMGQKQGDPFQLQVKISGPPFNLVYVGYGVSQVLPIVVDTLQASKGSTFLLQQPEVHLHPKAQAELGSFLSSLAKLNNTTFVIETHSDYLLDRIRMDVRDKKFLSADDISILYFERLGGVVSIHPIKIDENGNLLDVPVGYRQFFLEEERRMILGD